MMGTSRLLTAVTTVSLAVPICRSMFGLDGNAYFTFILLPEFIAIFRHSLSGILIWLSSFFQQLPPNPSCPHNGRQLLSINPYRT